MFHERVVISHLFVTDRAPKFVIFVLGFMLISFDSFHALFAVDGLQSPRIGSNDTLTNDGFVIDSPSVHLVLGGLGLKLALIDMGLLVLYLGVRTFKDFVAIPALKLRFFSSVLRLMDQKLVLSRKFQQA